MTYDTSNPRYSHFKGLTKEEIDLAIALAKTAVRIFKAERAKEQSEKQQHLAVKQAANA